MNYDRMIADILNARSRFGDDHDRHLTYLKLKLTRTTAKDLWKCEKWYVAAQIELRKGTPRSKFAVKKHLKKSVALSSPGLISKTETQSPADTPVKEAQPIHMAYHQSLRGDFASHNNDHQTAITHYTTAMELYTACSIDTTALQRNIRYSQFQLNLSDNANLDINAMMSIDHPLMNVLFLNIRNSLNRRSLNMHM
jgi:hypothetical protein